MKCTTPEISWHNRDPVLSVDIQAGVYEKSKDEFFWRVATGGADAHVLIWHLTTNENGGATVKCMADLERHQKAVNVVRFSPSKDILASGDDESVIILWKQKEDCDFFTHTDDQDKEQWYSWKVLRGHIEDVYDLSWSPDSNSLVSGSVDNTAILWDVQKGRSTGILMDHKGFVQGVSWDPCNQYICTISTDRQCRLIDIGTKKTVRVHKSKIPTPVDHPLQGKTVRLFYDDTFKSFFRRLTFSLDGALILVPSGIIESPEPTGKVSNATVVFSRHNLKEPIMILPSLDECTIAVRCCPMYFELRESGPAPMVSLPYRIVFAVATHRSVLIYDTQQTSPIAMISNIHYTRLTDVAWSVDGRILMVSSTDGYCSIIHFQYSELGNEYKNSCGTPLKMVNENFSRSSQSENDTNTNVSQDQKLEIDEENAMDIVITASNKKATNINSSETKKIIEEEAKEAELKEQSDPLKDEKSRKNKNAEDTEETEDIKLIYTEESESTIVETKTVPPKITPSPITLKRTPRRVQLITLSNPKGAKKT